jgi:hypothetical protein
MLDDEDKLIFRKGLEELKACFLLLERYLDMINK